MLRGITRTRPEISFQETGGTYDHRNIFRKEADHDDVKLHHAIKPIITLVIQYLKHVTRQAPKRMVRELSFLQLSFIDGKTVHLRIYNDRA